MHLLTHVVDNDVVTAWVSNDVVFKEEDVVAHVALKTEQESWLNIETVLCVGIYLCSLWHGCRCSLSWLHHLESCILFENRN